METLPIQNKIYDLRGRRVMLDFDLAQLYQVETRVLKQAVRRNMDRFPDDFFFELTEFEYHSLKESLRSQFVILENENMRGKHSKYMPFAFTEQGVSMLATVLRSPVAAQASISIMRAFVAMRNYLDTTATLTAELAELRTQLELLRRDGEETIESVNDLSEDVRHELDNLYNAIAALSVKSVEASKPRRPIGYRK